MIVTGTVGAAKLAALLISLSCTPVVHQGVYASECEELTEQSWIAPSPSELKACSALASDRRARGIKAWCELLPADDLGIEPAAERAAPAAYRF